MAKYILKRFCVSLVTLWVMFTATFLLMHAVPGNPFLGDKPLTKAAYENLNRKYGLDQPLYVQYVRYAKNVVLYGDFGNSIKKIGQSVSEIIGRSFPYSLRLGLVAVAISVSFGTLLGILGALKKDTTLDRVVMIIATVGVAVPGFVVATVCMVIFAVNLKILPIKGLDTPIHYILPSFSLALFSLSFIARLARSSMLDVISQDYIRTARAKGLTERVVIFKHALRNGILPVVTYTGPLMAGILSGSFVIEKVFTIPGLGKYFVESITLRDYPLILGVTLFYGTLLIAMNFLVDIIYGFVDPRIKISK